MIDIGRMENLGIERVLRRGSGEIVVSRDDALLVRDAVSGAYMLACTDPAVGLPLLDRHIGPDCGLLMVSDHALGLAAYQRFGFSEKLECYQFAYYGEKPAEGGIAVRTADAGDLAMLLENYHMISPGELERIVERGSVLLGYDAGRPVGFIGEHLEGSMGLLYVFPEYRRRGFGEALQKQMIRRTMEKGFIPFGQVEKRNPASLSLQEKLGMTRSDNLIVWMWKEL